MTEIYTLGTSNRSLKEFLDILKFYKIAVVIDVRRWPTSKYFPHFKKENLEKILTENNMSYFHFEKLGGYRESGYEEYTKTKDFKEGFKDLIKIVHPPKFFQKFWRARNKPTVIICAEKLPWKCHRTFIARILEEKGFKIIHMIDKDRIWSPKSEPYEIKPLCQKFLKKDDNSILKRKGKEEKK